MNPNLLKIVSFSLRFFCFVFPISPHHQFLAQPFFRQSTEMQLRVFKNKKIQLVLIYIYILICKSLFAIIEKSNAPVVSSPLATSTSSSVSPPPEKYFLMLTFYCLFKNILLYIENLFFTFFFFFKKKISCVGFLLWKWLRSRRLRVPFRPPHPPQPLWFHPLRQPL